ncbi:Snt309p Ecym_2612 [Eremothecium cymbalariae DBVPG|uniref:Pre-mRNA-splicing factor SPF27 n=1 Tax=Eremothecium cymbalariae (strain CBS 270.75 / DBVPG 7215 / KCTC 17166 / NRRL Y-17582) TaxID=931890 RepID=G8JQJ2_ERECY|nr:Hypothetical protein Ecym_2612 [Eremothecium cymbalariae DBVPG\
MNRAIDYLPYIDSVSDQYIQQVEQNIAEELEKTTVDGPHPNLNQLFPVANECKWQAEYNLYRETVAMNTDKDKRAAEDELLTKIKRQCVGIDMSRYDATSTDSKVLASMVSYLRHEDIVVSKLLPKTVQNQWLINKDYIENARATIEDLIHTQQQETDKLNRYRQQVQEWEALTFRYLKSQWQDKLNKNIEKSLQN